MVNSMPLDTPGMLERHRMENLIAAGKVVPTSDPRANAQAYKKMPWWGWVLVGLGIVLTGGLASHTVFAYKNAKLSNLAGKAGFLKAWKSTTFYGQKVGA